MLDTLVLAALTKVIFLPLTLDTLDAEKNSVPLSFSKITRSLTR